MDSHFKKNIHNAFILDGFLLSDQKYGIYCMAPRELLHTTREGISAYMIEVTKTIIGNDVRGMRVKAKIEAAHQRVFSDMARQSERNFPLGASRTGYLKNTKNNAEEIHSNIFYFYQCVFCHTDVG